MASESGRPVRGIRINENDLQLLSDLGDVGELDTTDVHHWYRSYKVNTVQKRLRLMAANGLIRSTRLLVSIDRPMDRAGGRIPAIHSLTPTGADLVEAMKGSRPLRVLTSEPTAGTFLHRRDIARVLRSFLFSCRDAGLTKPEFVLEQDSWAGAPKSLPPNQRMLLYHDCDVPGKRVVCRPDAAIRLRLPKTELVLFLEVDRASEGHKQLRNATRNEAYLHLFNRRLYSRYWPDLKTDHHFVMWICPSDQRISNIRETFADLPIAPVIRFAKLESFKDSTNVMTQQIWETMAGERRSIFRPERESFLKDSLTAANKPGKVNPE